MHAVTEEAAGMALIGVTTRYRLKGPQFEPW